MLNLLNRQKIELTGLDIGSSSVKLVRLNKGDEGYTLVAAAAEPIALCPDDEKQYRQNCVDAIKSCLKKANLKHKHVVCGVSGPEVVVRGFTFPPLPDTAVEQAVRMEAEQVCPLDMKHSVLDFQLVETLQTILADDAGKPAVRQGVMTVATESAIRQQTELLAQCGINPVMVDVNALALLNCLNGLESLAVHETVAVIDIGNTLTNVVIYGCDGLPFVRDVNIAGSNIIQAISRETELPEEQVRQALQEQGTELQDNKLLLALNNALVPLVNTINETLRFYSFQEKKTGVDRVFLCGGFALIDVFVEFLTDAMSTPVALLDPFSMMRCDPTVDSNETLEKNGPAFAVATGLAMRTL